VKKNTNKGYYAVQGHRGRYQSKARRLCDFLLIIKLTSYLVPFRSYRSLLVKFWTLCVFELPWRDLGTTYDVRLELIGKRVVDFLLRLIGPFSLGVTAEALRT